MTKEEVYALIEEHYHEHSANVIKRMGRHTGNHAHAEDIVQEAYLRMCLYWKSFDEEQNINTWFNQILNNSTKRFFNKEMMHGMASDSPPIETVSPAVFYKFELEDLVKRIYEKPEREKRILDLYLLREFTAKEVEEIVPESAANIRKVVQRFRDEIRGV